VILQNFKIEIAASSRNGGTARNDTNGLILLMLSLRAKRSNLLIWIAMIENILFSQRKALTASLWEVINLLDYRTLGCVRNIGIQEKQPLCIVVFAIIQATGGDGGDEWGESSILGVNMRYFHHIRSRSLFNLKQFNGRHSSKVAMKH
jgi:hypothetical protein